MTQMQTTWRDIDVSAYVDGELDPVKQAAFEATLAQDHALRQKVETMREVVALVRAAPLREPPRNYLLTPSMVAEKSPQSVKRPRMPLLFMRLATSLAAIAFVVTAGLTYVQRGVSPGMLTQTPKAADELPAMKAPPAVIATVEVEVMRASEPEAVPEPAANIEEDVQAEKAVEAEQPFAALAPAPPEATPQPDLEDAGAGATMNTQEREEAASPEALVLESAPVAEGQTMDKAERLGDDDAGTLSVAGEGELRAYDAGESADAAYSEPVTVERRRIPSWWLPAALGTVTLLLAGITFWMSRRR